jgi:glyoxylase-like metal-dependent hydrolase (beta-lactamase superfamily II)
MTGPSSGPPPGPLIHGRFDGGFGWIAHPGELMQRSSTALADGGRVWLIDPLRTDGRGGEAGGGIDGEIAALGQVVGVIISFAGHDRDGAWFANLYGVPVYLPRHLPPLRFDARVERVAARVPDSPLQLVPSCGRGLLGWFRDTAVWWPAQRTLAIGDTLGTCPYYLLPGERLAVHPVRRLQPPTELLTLTPERVYGGHGPSVTEGAGEAVARAVRTARSELWPAWRHILQVGWEALRRRRS